MIRWLCGLLLVCAAAQAWSHTLSVAHLDIAMADDGRAQVELDLALRDLALGFPIDADRDEVVTWGELRAQRAPIERWALGQLSLSTSSGTCTLAPTALATRRYDDGAYATLRMAATCPSATRLQVDYGLLFDRDPQHRALVTLRRGAATQTAIAHGGQRTVQLGVEGRGSTFVAFLREGIHHILIG